jgi:hypothetical protein
MENEEETNKSIRSIEEHQNQIKNQCCRCKVIKNYVMIISKRKRKKGENKETLRKEDVELQPDKDIELLIKEVEEYKVHNEGK